ncbi:unnamed protein product [Miscanthus lutarioriparius]|uniref:Jacalin-type lectin domain-containing protein n=1 Tax=Miscanthus lutarioriparius TaxID=422564 RepID=A0A811P7B7_9POAL|nr:unnamed protein product [Miscanthus lutarioriparius]
MRVEYVDRNGGSVHGEKHGGATERSHSVKIDVDFPYEFLTGVSGCYRAAHGGSAPPVVRSVTFATSRGTERLAPRRAGPLRRGAAAETLRDVVQERGLMAYRSFVYGDAGSAARHQDRSEQ